MNYKNAGIKNVKEFTSGLLSGEAYWDGFIEYRWNEEKQSFTKSNILFGYTDVMLSDFKDIPYPTLKFEVPWDEDITLPVLCWVSKICPSERGEIVYISFKDPIDNGKYFDFVHGAWWKYATPCTVEDFLYKGVMYD